MQPLNLFWQAQQCRLMILHNTQVPDELDVPMTLFESGNSTKQVNFRKLFTVDFFTVAGYSRLSVEQYLQKIIVGGFPNLINKTKIPRPSASIRVPMAIGTGNQNHKSAPICVPIPIAIGIGIGTAGNHYKKIKSLYKLSLSFILSQLFTKFAT